MLQAKNKKEELVHAAKTLAETENVRKDHFRVLLENTIKTSLKKFLLVALSLIRTLNLSITCYVERD